MQSSGVEAETYEVLGGGKATPHEVDAGVHKQDAICVIVVVRQVKEAVEQATSLHTRASRCVGSRMMRNTGTCKNCETCGAQETAWGQCSESLDDQICNSCKQPLVNRYSQSFLAGVRLLEKLSWTPSPPIYGHWLIL